MSRIEMLFCAWCQPNGQADVASCSSETGEWTSVTPQFAERNAWRASHGICPACVSRIAAKLRRRRPRSA